VAKNDIVILGTKSGQFYTIEYPGYTLISKTIGPFDPISISLNMNLSRCAILDISGTLRLMQTSFASSVSEILQFWPF